MEVSVSFLKSKYDFKHTIDLINETSCNMIHIDYMDNTFVNNTSIKDLDYLSTSNKEKEVHLMVNDPLKYLDYFIDIGIIYFIFPIEIGNTLDIINKVKEKGLKVGLSMEPDTSIDKVIPYINSIDMILIMSVHSGLGGQTFLDSTITKLKELNKIYKGRIEVDGGINANTVSKVKEYVTSIVSGSFICLSNNYQERINDLLK